MSTYMAKAETVSRKWYVIDAAGKPLKIKWAPIWLFGILANLPKIKKAGKHDIILFSKWTLSHNLVGDTEVGDKSFAEYIKSYFGKEN